MTKVHALLIALLLTLSACAHQGRVKAPKSLDKLSRQTRVQERKEEETRLQNLLATERAHVFHRSIATFPLPNPETEENVYALVLKAYQERDLDKLTFFSDRMKKKFGRSIFTDNALYLRGQLNLAMGLTAEALRDFEELLRDFPTANKRAAALLGKGMAYRKLQLYAYAAKTLKDLKKEFPGSPEFYKAELEERLLAADRSS